MKLAFNLEELAALQAAARNRQVETCAIGWVVPASVMPTGRFLVRQFREVPEQAYLERTSTRAVLAPDYCVEVANQARAGGMGVIFGHTHVGEAAGASFSHVDDAGEEALGRYFDRRVPHGPHFAVVISAEQTSARQLGTIAPAAIYAVGKNFRAPEKDQTPRMDQYDRQVRAFGVDGQQALQELRVAVVGLGGTGSVLVQQLAHLGVGDFLLVDPDTVAQTNLNRLVGASTRDVGRDKVAIAARQIVTINPDAMCETTCGDVVDEAVAAKIAQVDIVFSCTDSMASRAVLNQLAYQYLIPCIDVGVAIGVKDGAVKYITGRAQMLSPGLPCLVCTNLLDGEQIRREMMSDEQRSGDTYIVGATVVQPAVISLNSTMSSAAVSMFLGAVTGVPANARFVVYDGIRGSMRPQIQESLAHCVVCSDEGALGRGSTWQLPTRSKVRT
jgi:molybdopterin/thiamine biosynthesis adenylyltransferase